jgi:hypothetical protein
MRPGTVTRMPGGDGAGCRHHRNQHSFEVVNHRRASDQFRAITTLRYRNQSVCYARTVAYSSGSAILFSSGDSPQHASSILSGEGFDEVQPGESPFVVFCSIPLPCLAQFYCATAIKLHRLIAGNAQRLPAKWLLALSLCPWSLSPALFPLLFLTC